MSVVRLIVATRSGNILISGKIIKEMPGSVASGTHCILRDLGRPCFISVVTSEPLS